MNPSKPDGWAPPQPEDIRAAVREAGGPTAAARALGLSVATVGHWQNGRHPINWPCWYTLLRLSDFYDRMESLAQFVADAPTSKPATATPE